MSTDGQNLRLLEIMAGCRKIDLSARRAAVKAGEVVGKTHSQYTNYEYADELQMSEIE